MVLATTEHGRRFASAVAAGTHAKIWTPDGRLYDAVRVAITGAASSVFRHAGLEAALNQSFTPASAAAVKIDASDLNADIHASAAYRANLISVQTQRAVAQILG